MNQCSDTPSLDDEEFETFTISSISHNSEIAFKFKFMNEIDIKKE